MFNKLCEPEHLIIIILALVLALLVVGSGRGLGKFIGQVLKKIFGGTEVNLNLGGDMSGKLKKECEICGIFPDPNKCPFHQAEHERSIRNETEISKLWEHYGKLGEEMRSGFKEVQACITRSQEVIITALGSRQRGK